jgi:hypothetical protein
VRLRPERRNHVWSYDFVSARTHDGRSVRLLNLIDEHTRESLLVRAERRWSSARVISALADVMVMKGVPEHLSIRQWAGGSSRKTYGNGWPKQEQSRCISNPVRQRRDLLLDERAAGSGRTLARPLQHRQTTLLAGL